MEVYHVLEVRVFFQSLGRAQERNVSLHQTVLCIKMYKEIPKEETFRELCILYEGIQS